MDEIVKNAILEMVRAFSNPKDKGSFRDGLSVQEYNALRKLNVLRIDYGDSREP